MCSLLRRLRLLPEIDGDQYSADQCVPKASSLNELSESRSLPVGVGYQKNCQRVENEHEYEKHLSPATRSVELFPGQHAPKCGDHRSRLANGIRNCHSGKAGSDQIENHAQAPDKSTKQAENVSRRRSAEIAAETDRLADQRLPHEVDIPDRAGKQRAQSQEYGHAVR